jgi:TonB family protein
MEGPELDRACGHREAVTHAQLFAKPREPAGIDSTGRVREVTIVQPTPYHDLEHSTHRALLRLAFLPGTIDGQALEVTDTVTYNVSGFAR